MSCDSKGICDFFKKYWSIVIVFTAFINNIFYSGFIYSYNLLYLELHNTFNSTATQTGIPGAVSVSLFSGCCIFVTFIFQKIGHQKTIILGVTLCCLGLLVSSFSQRITWLYITYGVFYGFGICCIYMSFTDKIMRSFKKRYSSTVTCTAFIGASLGIMLAPVIEWLYKQYKWRVTLRIFSGVFAVIGYSSTLVLVDCESTTHGHYNETEESDDNEEGKQNKDENNSEHEGRQDEDTNDSIEKLERKEEENSEQSDDNKENDHNDGEPVMFKEVNHTNDVSNDKMYEEPPRVNDVLQDLVTVNDEKHEISTRPTTTMSLYFLKYITVFRRKDFVTALLGVLLTATAVLFSYISVGNFLFQKGVEKVNISIVMLWMGFGDVIGRILTAVCSDRLPVSRLCQYAITDIVAAVTSICLPFISTEKGLTVALFVLSMPRAVLNILPAALSTEISTDETRPEAMALVYLMFGIGALITPYITDSIYDVTGTYDLTWIICTALYVIAAIFLLLALHIKKQNNVLVYDRVEKTEIRPTAEL
ncbi:uncharacterized protein [Antedon mediterranea]|uniref:uncharacterized protein isoform X2 n=1 Tax=Antedon mediterranea TaxID=105859 RepID=UPI003AF47835